MEAGWTDVEWKIVCKVIVCEWEERCRGGAGVSYGLNEECLSL
jgi:hypothetical protein